MQPKNFFSGAFSSHRKYYHHETKTLPPTKFFLLHMVIISILTSIVGWLLFGKYESDDFFISLFEIGVTLAWLYVPAFFLNLILNWNLSRWQNQRRKSILTTGTINFENTLQSFFYCTPAQIFSIPVILLVTELLAGSYSILDFELSYFIFFFILAMIGKFISYYFILPNALQFSCRIPRDVAVAASVQLMLLPQVIINFLRLCTAF